MHDCPTILTIAGSDSGGGAGIQADLKTFAMLGGYGASVLTALTAQNTMAVTGIHPVPADFVVQQYQAVTSDMNVRAAKTGMLFSAEIIKALGQVLAQRSFPLVVDPVCVSQSGTRLLEESAVAAMVRNIFPLADLLTPNLPEAELFAGMRIKTAQDICEAAERLLALGPKAVLIKGGHMDSPASTDWYVTPGQKAIPLMQTRVDTKNLHGTGCTLSAAIAAHLGLGLDMLVAVRRSQHFLHAALRASYAVGAGGGSPNHAVPLVKEQARLGLLRDLAAQVLAVLGAASEDGIALAPLLPPDLSSTGPLLWAAVLASTLAAAMCAGAWSLEYLLLRRDREPFGREAFAHALRLAARASLRSGLLALSFLPALWSRLTNLPGSPQDAETVMALLIACGLSILIACILWGLLARSKRPCSSPSLVHGALIFVWLGLTAALAAALMHFYAG